MKPLMLFRDSPEHRDELAVARKHFEVETQRSRFASSWYAPHDYRNQVVVARYPLDITYRELESDINYFHHLKLTNNYNEHRYIANFDYYSDIWQYTPKTYSSMAEVIRSGYAGPLVIKGKTNSRKHQWATHCYAETINDAWRVTSELQNDSMIGYQDLIYREYVPLLTFETGINGIRYTNEFRIFFWKDKLIDYGYYWSTSPDWCKRRANLTDAGLKIAQKVAKIVSEHTTFFALDIAELFNDVWYVVEINDGSMSGLSEIDPESFYKNFAKALNDA
jgi:hypothetical protein